MRFPLPTRSPGRMLVPMAVLLCALSVPTVASADRGDVVGEGPLGDVLAAAAGHPRCAGLTPNELTAMVFAPTWPETGASPGHAASPLVFSRWDDHDDFYSFKDRSSMVEAFWHPGVGMWQMDSAGLGRPFNAGERVDTTEMAGEVVDEMARRYCARTSHAEGLRNAWKPWHGCMSTESRFQACRATYDNLLGHLAAGTLVVDTAIDSREGLDKTTCRHTADGSNRLVSCYVVDTTDANTSNPPVPLELEQAMGEAASAMITPLSKSFVTYSLDGREWRQWLRSSTGYATDVHAWRSLGANARGGISWRTGRSAEVVGGLPEDAPSDLLLFRNADRRVVSMHVGEGGATSTLWWTNWRRNWSEVVTADLDADGIVDDALLYNRDTGSYSVQAFRDGRPSGIASGSWWTGWDVTAGDFDGNGIVDDLLLARASDNRFNVTHVTGAGTTRRLHSGHFERAWTDFRALDLDGDGLLDDVLAYDGASGAFEMLRIVDGQPVTHRAGAWWAGWDGLVPGDFDGNGLADDLLLFRNDTGRFNITHVRPDGRTSRLHSDVWARPWTTFTPADLDSDGRRDDVLLYNRDSGAWSMQRLGRTGPDGIAFGSWSSGWEFLPAGRLR